MMGFPWPNLIEAFPSWKAAASFGISVGFGIRIPSGCPQPPFVALQATAMEMEESPIICNNMIPNSFTFV
jgi:hypothetical protein